MLPGMNDQPQPGIGLADAIGTIRSELERAIREGADAQLGFTAGAVELELEVVFSGSRQAEAGVKAWVVSIGGSAGTAESKSHKVKVTLQPIDRATRQTAEIGDVGPR